MTDKFKANLLVSLLIIAIALPIAALADQGLKIAIDDGTPGNQRFVDIDYGDAGDSATAGAQGFDMLASVAVMTGQDIAGEPETIIISGKPVDDATRERIRALLIAAGHGAEIVFVVDTASRYALDSAEHLTSRLPDQELSEE